MMTASRSILASLCALALLSLPASSQGNAPVSSSVPGKSTPVVYPEQTKISLETSETIFSVLAALDGCALSRDVSNLPLALSLRSDLALARKKSAVLEAQQTICSFVHEHGQKGDARDLAPYISLALFLNPPPDLRPRVAESDLPPDASYVLGFLPLLRQFAAAAELHGIWQKHEAEYAMLQAQFRQPVAQLIADTDFYLRLPIAGYLGRQMQVIIDPLGLPAQVNARNYGPDYFLVLTPAEQSLKLDAIRHLYLHYLLDPLVGKKYHAVKSLEPILEDVQSAPLDSSFKTDIRLMVVESLIRAVEAREPGRVHPKEKTAAETFDREQEAAVDSSMRDGYVLTSYFFNCLKRFEKEPTGLQDSLGNWLYDLNMQLGRERKLAQSTRFHSTATPEIVHAAKPVKASLVEMAEQHLGQNDPATAIEDAKQALQRKEEDPARAMFVLARASLKQGQGEEAKHWLEQTLAIANEPRIIAWSHIYLARLLDLREQRDEAVKHYNAALSAGDLAPDTRSAAESGLAKPYVARPNP